VAGDGDRATAAVTADIGGLAGSTGGTVGAAEAAGASAPECCPTRATAAVSSVRVGTADTASGRDASAPGVSAMLVVATAAATSSGAKLTLPMEAVFLRSV
jgi:hypothetical protein